MRCHWMDLLYNISTTNPSNDIQIHPNPSVLHYMWGLGVGLGILRFRCSEIEFQNRFSILSQHLLSTEHIQYLSDCWKIRPSEIECESDFSSSSQ